MSKVAFIFPGQGVQKAGMGKDFYDQYKTAAKVFDQATELLGIDMKKLCFEENDRLDQTEYTQAALVTVCMAMERVAEEEGLVADVTAGLSLGEYCAIVTAGGMKLKDAIRITRKRGLLMQNAIPDGQGAMAAVLGLSGEIVEKTVASMEGVSVANYNCPGQIVITGWNDAVEKAAERLKAAGAKRILPLKVSGPFHSPLLKEAGKELGEELKSVELSELQIPYVTNVTAEYVSEIDQTKALLAKQVAASVRWQQSIEKMLSQGVDTFIETGPGRTLTGFMRKISREVRTYNISTVEDLKKVVNELCKIH